MLKSQARGQNMSEIEQRPLRFKMDGKHNACKHTRTCVGKKKKGNQKYNTSYNINIHSKKNKQKQSFRQ